ncbi:MAG: response regulator [Pseudomonadota bacterium]
MARILVVDDSRTDVEQMSTLLSKHGHQVLTADSASRGIEVAGREQPDIILMDVVMPGVNGFQATRELTRADTTRHIPIVIVSNKSQQADRIWGERQGASGYVTKPVNQKEILTLVKDLVAS